MWLSVVCTLIDNDIRHHSGQNVADSRGAAVFDRGNYQRAVFCFLFFFVFFFFFFFTVGSIKILFTVSDNNCATSLPGKDIFSQCHQFIFAERENEKQWITRFN